MTKQKQDFQKIQTYILKVNIHCECDGCVQKVEKLLQKIDGVYSVNIDAEQGKVVVTGVVDPATLIKKLKRSGKHAEIWGGGQRGMMYNQNHPINAQFQNFKVGNGKGGKDNKSQNQKGQKGDDGGGDDQLAHFQNMKGFKDLKVPSKQHKPVKFNLEEEEFESSDDDDDFNDYDEEDGYDHGHPMHNNMMPVMGNGGGPHGPAGMMNGPAMNSHKGYGGGNFHGSAKKVIDVPIQIKGKVGNYGEIKKGNKMGMKSNGEMNKGGGGGDNNNGTKKKNSKSEGGLLGRFLGFGKKSSKKGGVADAYKNSKNGKEGKKGGGKLEGYGKNSMSKNDFDFLDFDTPSHDKNGKSGKGNKGNKKGNMGQMGPMNQQGPMGRMGNIPDMNSGGEYHQGMQMQPPPYNNLQQHHYMAQMMNQQQHQQQLQQANMNNNMYPQAMMYGRSHPSMNYMPPPPMPSHPMADPMTHVFSDENTEGYCNIM